MNATIKLNEGIEGAEVRDALKWVKRITENDINKMKIGKKGFLFSFIDSQHIIAGKVFIPSTGELWHSEKEVGFNCERLFNAFSIFNRRDKTELYIKENRLFLKNGGLKWRYEMEDVKQAEKIDFSKIPTPAIRINIKDLIPLKSINKGKIGSEKSSQICFRYGNGKAALFVFDRYGKNRIDIGEVSTEGEGAGIALYNLVLLEKLIKDAKTGFIRIEEGKPTKLKIRTGKVTKAVLHLAPMLNSDLIEEIRGEGVPSSPAQEEEKPTEEMHKHKVEILAEGVAVSDDRIKGEKVRLEQVNGNYKVISKYRIKTDKGAIYERADKLKDIMITWNWLIGEEEEKESEEVKQLKDDIRINEETLEKAEKEEENREPEAGEEEIFNAAAPKLEEEVRQARAELDRIQEQEKIEQEKAKGFREAIYKSEIVSVCFFDYLEGTKDTIYRDQEGYEYQSNTLNFDTLEINKIKELKRIDKAATDAAEEMERDKIEAAFKETEKAVKEWEDTYKETEEVKEVVKEGISFLTVKEANGAAYHNSKEVYEDMKAEAQIDRECLWVLHLVGGNVLKKELVAMGKGNAAYTTPREIFRRAIIEGTTKIIMVHNHPSGDPTPSDSDITVCETYVKAGELLGIGLLDFIVIGTQGYRSFADKGIGGF